MALVNIPTLDQQLKTIRARILALNPNINTLPGSVAGDLFLVPQAESDVQQLAVSYYLNAQKSVNGLLALKVDTNMLTIIAAALNKNVSDILNEISTSLNELGSNFSLTRNPATAASGFVYFVRFVPPTTDITISANSIVRSVNGTQYTTTQTVTMYKVNNNYNNVLSGWAISVPVTATSPGASTNAAAYTITTLVSPVNGFTAVANTSALTGGSDLESDEAFGSRILLSWQAKGRLTKAGLRQLITSTYPGVEVYVAPPGDPLSLRGEGRTDIYVRGPESSELKTETFSEPYNSAIYGSAIRPTFQPIINLDTFTSGQAFLQVDNQTVLSGSVQAQDAFRFTSNPSGTPWSVTIGYYYNSLISKIQNLFNSDDNAPINQIDPTTTLTALETPILVKAASVLAIDYSAPIMVLPGYTKANVISTVVTNLTNFINDQTINPMGTTIYQTDLNEVVEKSEGVLRLTGAPSKFSPSSQSGVLNSISLAANQYAVLLNVVIS